MKSKKARVIAFYLPQFHPIPENDKYWGKGFTEWTNVAKAKPLFKGHYQPRIPADLGFYDLRLPQIQEAQAEMAIDAGIEAFCYFHYWFGNGKMLLEKPFEQVLNNNNIKHSFCFCWANHDWTTKTWKKEFVMHQSTMIAKQEYPGEVDIIEHFNYCLPAFKDERYVKVENKPLFVIYAPLNIPDLNTFMKKWNTLAKENGLDGIYFVGVANGRNINYNTINKLGLDGVLNNTMYQAQTAVAGSVIKRRLQTLLGQKMGVTLMKYDYSKVVMNMYSDENKILNCYPQITPGLDRTPRAGRQAVIYYNATPDAFQSFVRNTLDCIKDKDYDHKLIFLNAWNEWGEGNYMEPDLKYGHAFINALKSEIFE